MTRRLEHSKVQSVYFPDNEWQARDAARWVVAHGYKPIKMTHEGRNYRFRITHPYAFESFATKRALHNGKLVYFVIGSY